jgi:hypothetical protein
MAMRSQVYEWDGARGTTPGTTGTMLGRSLSIFIGGVGNNITMPASTTATQFVVIEEIAATPTYFGIKSTITASTSVRGLNGASTNSYFGPLAYAQIVINTTEYFQDPDNVSNYGVPGAASPYPRSVNFQPSFSLHPTVYVLPGQTWDVRYTTFSSNAGVALGDNQCFTKYTLYDGPDSLIRNKLLEMGITVNPGNVDWYKRSLLSAASAPAPTNGA